MTGTRARHPPRLGPDDSRAPSECGSGWAVGLLALAGIVLVGCVGDPSVGELRPSASPRPTAIASVPTPGTPPPSAPAPADSSGSTARPTPAPAATGTPSTEPIAGRTRTYVVAAGDTLWGIGRRYGLSVQDILLVNARLEGSVIRPGDELIIPLYLLPVADGVLELPDLPTEAGGSVELPGCAAGLVSFARGYWFPDGAASDWWRGTWIEDVARTDVDHDGAAELIVSIACQPSQAMFRRVIAFRPMPDGSFSTIGVVVQEDRVAGEWDPDRIQGIAGIGVTTQGEVVATLWSLMCACSPVMTPAVTQERTYAWVGGAFVQVEGPTSFVVPPGTVELTLRNRIDYSTPDDGVMARTITIWVRNEGSTAVEDVSVVIFDLDFGLYERSIGRLEPGVQSAVVFQDAGLCMVGTECPAPSQVQIRVGDQAYCHTKGSACVIG